MQFLERRRVLSTAAAAAFGLAVPAGCATETANAGRSGATGNRRSLDSPVRVEHRFGSTTVDAVPRRVVSLDLQWTDTMLALGTEPVGYGRDRRMPKSGVPWQRLSSATAFRMDDGVPVEEILRLRPDLIVGTFSIPDAETYRLLSDIAPTIASLDSRQVSPWRQLVGLAGKLLDRRAKARQVVRSVESEVRRTAEDLPGLRGQTFLLAQYLVGDGMYLVSDPQDGSSVLFRQLGMKLYPPVARQGERTGQPRVQVNPERSDLLRSDLLAFLINGGDRRDLADIAGFDRLPGTVAVLDYATVVGLNTPSALSLPYALAELRPYLERAAANRPR